MTTNQQLEEENYYLRKEVEALRRELHRQADEFQLRHLQMERMIEHRVGQLAEIDILKPRILVMPKSEQPLCH